MWKARIFYGIVYINKFEMRKHTDEGNDDEEIDTHVKYRNKLILLIVRVNP